jgi:DNA-binding MarR family transcriptional regulator
VDSQRDKARIDEMATDCIALGVRTLNRVITAVYDDALRSLGLKVGQLNILVAAAKRGVASPGKVCQVLEMDASTLSRNLERMRARGWIEIVPGKDARAQPFALTPAGRRLLHKAIPAWETAQAEARRLLGERGGAMLKFAPRTLHARAE